MLNSLHQFWNKSIPLQILYPASVSRKIIPLYFFLAQTIYTLLKRSSLKWKFLRLSSARVKFCQIPYANFEMKSWFLSKFCIPLQFHEGLLLYFFSSNNINFAHKEPIKVKILATFECSGQNLINSLFETFKCSGQNSSNSSRQFWNDNSIFESQFFFKICIILHCHGT